MTDPRSPLKVLFLAVEADPFVKIGGLGDVAGSLPLALRRLSGVEGNPDLDIRLALPFHGAIQRRVQGLQPAASYIVNNAYGPIPTEALQTTLEGMPVYFISGPPISPDEPVYSPNIAADAYKFTYFSLAALELCRALGWTPDVIHANDWHTSPALYALALRRPNDPWFQSTAGLITLHNLPYMGGGAESALWDFGLPPSTDERLPWWARHQPLPLGLLSADHIVAASPGYAQEVLTPEFGSGLDGFLQTRRLALSGILNGLQTERWDPANDSALAARYNAGSLDLRRENKSALLGELGLEDEPGEPLFSVVSRMDPQKGIDLIPAALRQIQELPWKIVILGSGIPEIEDMCRWLEFEFPGRVRTAIRYDAALSRRIYSAADMLLVPSRYEPCGLTQMIAMRYGCAPIARATGGLRDTIKDFDQSPQSTGFVFAEANSNALAARLRRALTVYRDPAAWRAMQLRGMAEDFSWGHFAQEYLDLYQRLAAAAPLAEIPRASPL